jgi:chemotaxis methyl-accepting protein methylase
MGIASREFESFLKAFLPGMGLSWRRYCRRNIRRRLLHRLDALGLSSLEGYGEVLRSDEREFQVFYNLLTVTISRFFRNRKTYELLRDVVIPDIVEREGRLRIWSIGGASGEEPYSLAILWDAYLKDRYPEIKPVIVATDIDRECLERAGKGVYQRSSLKEVPKGLVERYFTQERHLLVLDEGIKRMVELRFHDVLRDEPIKGNSMVLCRNLAFTYFGRELQRRSLGVIHTSLLPKGYLVIGRKEILPEDNIFEPVYPMDGIYRRTD